MRSRGRLAAVACALLAVLMVPCASHAADSGASAPANGWHFNFTPYAWATSVNGSATAGGHTVDINDSFFQIVEKTDSLLPSVPGLEQIQVGDSVVLLVTRAVAMNVTPV